jgi:hypothetical protein
MLGFLAQHDGEIADHMPFVQPFVHYGNVRWLTDKNFVRKVSRQLPYLVDNIFRYKNGCPVMNIVYMF